MRAVIDTNVLVAAARSRQGSSFALIESVRRAKWQMVVSTALLLEYEYRLKIEARRQGRPAHIVEAFLDELARLADRRETFFLLRPFLRDPSDDFIVELAVAARADFIVTWNVRDFAEAGEYGVQLITPRDFLTLVENL